MAFIPMSPSNMMTYLQCPLRFYASSISREMPWKPSKSKLRGTRIHSDVEKCIKEGWQEDIVWDAAVCKDFLRQELEMLERKTQAREGKVFVEQELAVNKAGQPCTFWDENVVLRARADAVLVAPDYVYLIDIKTGRKWDEEDFQLRVEALLANAVYQCRFVDYAYWYVDSGEIVGGFIDFTKSDLYEVQDVLDCMRDMTLSMKNNHFPARRNKFCKWCDYYQTPKCK